MARFQLGRRLRVPVGHRRGQVAWPVASIRPRGLQCGVSSRRALAILWDAQTFARVTTLRAGTGQIRTISFSRDVQLLAGSAYISPTIVWDLSLVRRTLAEMNLDW